AAPQLRPAAQRPRLGSLAPRPRAGTRRRKPQERLRRPGVGFSTPAPSIDQVSTKKPLSPFHEGEIPVVRIAATEERVLNVPASPESVYAFFSRPETLCQAMASVERCERLPDDRVRWVLAEKVD